MYLINEIRLYICKIMIKVIIEITPKQHLLGKKLLKNMLDYLLFEEAIRLKEWIPVRK